MKGDLADAVRIYAEVTSLAPGNQDLVLASNKLKVELRQAVEGAMKRAKEAQKREDHAAAFKEFKKVLDLQPDNSEAQAGLKESGRKARIKAADPKKVNDLYYTTVE